MDDMMKREAQFGGFGPPAASSDDAGFEQQSTPSVFTVTIRPTGDTYAYEAVTSTTSDDSFSVPPQSTTSSDNGFYYPISSTTSSSTSSTSATSIAPSSYSSPSSSVPQAGESQPTFAPTQHQQGNSNGLSPGGLAVAIVVPIVVVLALLLFAIFFLRRRRNTGARVRAGSGTSTLREKWGSLRSGSSMSDRHPPEMMNVTNSTYFTGLDTSSHGTERGSEGESEPPPPYVQRPSTAAVRNALPEVPHIQIDMSEIERFPTPPTTSHGHLAPHDPPQPSWRSARSFTSDLYSDTASVHSARAARRSFGQHRAQPVMLGGPWREEDDGPFDDEMDSPVSPL